MRILILATCVSFLLFGCSTNPSSSNPPTETLASLTPLSDAPEFELQAVIGNSIVRSADLKNKVVVVDFWATWCPPCIEEIPNYNKLHEEIVGRDVVLLGITVLSGERQDVQPKVEEFGIKYPVVMGTDGVEQGFGGTIGLPTTYVIGKDWKVYKRYLGYRPQKKVELERDIALLITK